MRRPSTWRSPPLQIAAVLLLSTGALWLRPELAAAIAWGLAAVGAVQLLAGVGEIVERRVRRSAAPAAQVEQQPEGRLLAAVPHDGGAATILACAGAAKDEVAADQTAFVEDLRLVAPKEPGLHVWEGRIVETPDDGTGYEPDWVGSWRRATPEEALRFAAGEPVWGSR